MKLRDYQIDISKKASKTLKELNIVYIAAMVRVGKTLMALNTCKLFGAEKVLFITKKKAISSIENDFEDFGFTYKLTIRNKESLHKIKDNDFDVIIIDEAQ